MTIGPSYPPTPPRGARRGVAVALAVAGTGLLAASALLLALFVTARSDAHDAAERLALVERDLAGAEGRLAANRSTVDTLAARHEELSTSNAALHACADPAGAAIAAARTGDDAALSTAVDEMLSNCGG